MPKHDPGELEGFAKPMQRYRCNAVMSENGMVRAVPQPCHQAKLARGIEDKGARHVPKTRLWREIPNLWRTVTRPLHIWRANLPIPASTIGVATYPQWSEFRPPRPTVIGGRVAMQVQRAVDGLARSGIGQERDNREVRSPRGPALPMPPLDLPCPRRASRS